MHESPQRGRWVVAVGESNRPHLRRIRAYPQSPAGTADSSRGRKPTEERPKQTGSPKGAAPSGLLSCRPFRAPCFVFVTYRGLAPTAKFRRRYAAPQPRMVSSMRLQPRPHSPRCYAAPQPPTFQPRIRYIAATRLLRIHDFLRRTMRKVVPWPTTLYLR